MREKVWVFGFLVFGFWFLVFGFWFLMICLGKGVRQPFGADRAAGNL
jgi:hypothetical protein